MQSTTPPVISGRIGRTLDFEAIQAAASALEGAERSGKQIRLLSEIYPEITMDDAYAIQDCWIGMKLAAGEKLAGWKIGLTSKAMQASVSIDIPDSGALLESMRFPNGAVIVPGRFIQPRIEAEIAFVMKGPLEGTAAAEDVLAATDYIAPALEILDTRIARKDPQTGKLRTVYDTISDNAADGGFVLGDAVTDFSGLDMRWLGAIVSRDGEVEETGLSAGVLNNPLMSVACWRNVLRPMATGLRPARLSCQDHSSALSRPFPEVKLSAISELLDMCHVSSSEHLRAKQEAPMNPFKAAIGARRAQIGLWQALASPYTAEICAGSGFDWLLIDAEHAPNDIPLVLAQLQATAAYPVEPMVRIPSADAVLIKQYLDIGARSLMVPMVETAEMATGIVRATRYPPHGIRGVGSAIGRASRWNRRAGYLQKASEEICVVVQLETVAAIKNLHAIAQVEGVDGIFLGPSDLAADMGYLGNAQHCDVQMLIENALAELNKLGVPAGILMADEALAKRYLELGVSFIAVGTDISLLARGAEQLCARFRSMNGES